MKSRWEDASALLQGVIAVLGLFLAVTLITSLALVPPADKNVLDAWALTATFVAGLFMAEAVIQRYARHLTFIVMATLLVVLAAWTASRFTDLDDPNLLVTGASSAVWGIAGYLAADKLGARIAAVGAKTLARVSVSLGFFLLTFAFLLQLRSKLYVIE